MLSVSFSLCHLQEQNLPKEKKFPGSVLQNKGKQITTLSIIAFCLFCLQTKIDKKKHSITVCYKRKKAVWKRSTEEAILIIGF